MYTLPRSSALFKSKLFMFYFACCIVDLHSLDASRLTPSRYEKCMNKKHLVERNSYMAFFAAFLPLLIR